MSNNVHRKSIFELETRVNLFDEFVDIECDLNEIKCEAIDYSGKSLRRIISQAMRTWPYRDGNSTISGFLEKRGIQINIAEEADETAEEDILYTLELYIYLLEWAIAFDKVRKGSISYALDNKKLEDDLFPVIENVTNVLEKRNYVVRKQETSKAFPQYVITKRNASVDVAIQVVPELSEALLAYYDLRNKNDEKAKKSILLSLYEYLEPKKKEYKGTSYYEIYTKVFQAFNKFKIRHNDKEQIQLSKKQRMQLYDRTFDMCIHLLVMPSVAEYKAMIDGYINKSEQDQMQD